MKNIRLIDSKEDIRRGAILRCIAEWPYEDFVEFMVTEKINDYASRPYSLLVVSGYKAGLTFRVLPEESIPKEKDGYAISTEWLISNWYDWGYADCPLESVHVIYKDPPTDFYNL